MATGRDWHRFPRHTRNAAETFAGIILKDRISELFAIPTITREHSYNTKHTGQADYGTSTVSEDRRVPIEICGQTYYGIMTTPDYRVLLAMFGKTYHAIGTILDYQVPLENSRVDDFIGQIDMIAYEGNTLTLLELKKKGRYEEPKHGPGGLLRATLKVFSHWKTVDHGKLLADFNLPPDTIIAKAVLLFENSYSYDEYVKKTSPNIIELMKRLDVWVFGIKEFDGNYEVFLPPDNGEGEI